MLVFACALIDATLELHHPARGRKHADLSGSANGEITFPLTSPRKGTETPSSLRELPRRG